MLTFNSKIERNLLAYFFLNTSKEHHLHEIARIIKADPANLNKKLSALTKLGLFRVRKRGNLSLYSLNPSFFLFNEYKSIVNKTYGIEHLLKLALQKIPGVKKAYIFGSYVSGRFDEHSDIDLLVIGEQDGLILSNVISKLEDRLGREINTIEIDPQEFRTRRLKDPFIKTILAKNIIELTL